MAVDFLGFETGDPHVIHAWKSVPSNIFYRYILQPDFYWV
jgi:hypothetical protein